MRVLLAFFVTIILAGCSTLQQLQPSSADCQVQTTLLQKQLDTAALRNKELEEELLAYRGRFWSLKSNDFTVELFPASDTTSQKIFKVCKKQTDQCANVIQYPGTFKDYTQKIMKIDSMRNDLQFSTEMFGEKERSFTEMFESRFYYLESTQGTIIAVATDAKDARQPDLVREILSAMSR